MKQKKIPMRSCTVTGEKLPKIELLRIVRTKEGNVICDLTGKVNGRGAYIKKDLEVLEKARKTKILEKRLECKIDDSVYEEVENEIKKI
ncbi:MAG: YlxR family protein [Bacilli bacterium]|nr:YlxR family protein [Bacilli bacterium]